MSNQESRTRTKHKLIVRSVTKIDEEFIELRCTETKVTDTDIGQRDLGETEEVGFKSHEQYRTDTPSATWTCITSLNNRYRVGDEVLIDFRPAR